MSLDDKASLLSFDDIIDAIALTRLSCERTNKFKYGSKVGSA